MNASIAYAARTAWRPRYHANDQSRDRLEIVHHDMPLSDGRAALPTLDASGFCLVPHHSEVTDWHDSGVRYRDEIIALIQQQTGAAHVVINSPGLLRFSEQSAQSGALNNSRPARFAHVDVSTPTAEVFAAQALSSLSAPKRKPPACPPGRFAHYNIWRVLSVPPQDVPLAVCDARSVSTDDLIPADAVFDTPGKPDWSFEGLVVAHNAAHRWHWFPDMHCGEALIFKTFDSDAGRARCVPHVAFNNPLCPPDAPPRMSIEMRAIAYWH